MLARDNCHVETVTEFKSRLNESLNDSKFSYQVWQARQSAQRERSCKSRSQNVGGRLWIHKTLFKDEYSKSQKFDKFSAKRFGPVFEAVSGK